MPEVVLEIPFVGALRSLKLAIPALLVVLVDPLEQLATGSLEHALPVL